MMVTTLEDEIKSLRNAFTGNDSNINEIIKMSSPWTKEQEKIYANNSKSIFFKHYFNTHFNCSYFFLLC